MSTQTVTWPRVESDAEPWIQMVKAQGGSGSVSVVLHWHQGRFNGYHYELRGGRKEPSVVTRVEEP